MNICEQWRQEIKALLPCGFLRISRDGGFLFVSDFPLHVEKPEAIIRALKGAGFTVTLREKIACLDAAEEKYAQAAAAMEMPPVCPMDRNPRLVFIARLLMGETEGECIPLIRFVMRCTALKDEKMLAKLPELLAVQKRKKEPLSPLAGKILLQYLAETEEKLC